MAINILTDKPQLIKPIKLLLESKNLLDKSRKIITQNDGSVNKSIFVIPTNLSSIDLTKNNELETSEILYLTKQQEEKNIWYQFRDEDQSIINVNIDTNKITLETIIINFFKQYPIENDNSLILTKKLLSQIPKRYSLYDPMILFPLNSFTTSDWKIYFNSSNDHKHESQQQILFFKYMIFKFPIFKTFTHIATNNPIIEQDIMRRPFNLIPLYGDFGPEPTPSMFESPTIEDFQNAFWVKSIQNGINQVWAPRFTMFSRGNIKEKERILKFKSNEEKDIIIDLYCGIGYFTFSYLKNNNNCKVFGWEINPWSIEGIKKGSELNKWTIKVISQNESFKLNDYLKLHDVRLFVFHESNENAFKRLNEMFSQNFENENKFEIGTIKHINLGLLPTSKPSWDISCNISLLNLYHNQLSSVMVHVHDNVSEEDLEKWYEDTRNELLTLLLHNIKKLKTQNEYKSSVSKISLNRIKTFAPSVWHVCGDYLISIY